MSAAWKTPVTKRSADACLNAEDLNRIEQNVTYLAKALGEAGYRVTRYPEKTWDETMIPTQSDFVRLYNAVTAITTAYHDWLRVDIRPFATKPLTGEIVDAVEQKLLDVKALMSKAAGYETNTHQQLAAYTYEQLGAYTHDQLKKQSLSN